MDVTLTPQQRAAWEAAVTAEAGVRPWKRYEAVRFLAAGGAPARVAHVLRCRRASVSGWAARWRRDGIVGLREGDHGGGHLKVDADGEALLVGRLGEDPQTRGHRATGGTVPLLQSEFADAGDAVADRTLRRAWHRLGYRGKRPHSLLGRPDPAYEAKKGGESSKPRRSWPAVARCGWPMQRPCGSSRHGGQAGASEARRRRC